MAVKRSKFIKENEVPTSQGRSAFESLEKQCRTEYDISWKHQKPKIGWVKLTKDEIAQSMALIWTGAEATVDALLGVELDKEKSNIVKKF